MSFYWFDIIIIGFTLLLGLKGGVNGLIKEIFGLVGIIGGVFLASKLAEESANLIQTHLYQIANQDLAEFAGFLVVLILFWLLCLVLGSFLSKLVKFSGLGFLNFVGGFLFGGAKVFLIFAILVFCIAKINFLNEKLENFAKDSYTLNILKQSGAYIMNQPLAQNLTQQVEEKTSEVLQGSQEQNQTDLNATQGELHVD